MIRVSTVTARAPQLALRWRRQSLPSPSKQRDAVDEAVALHRREALSRRLRDATELSFLMSGGRYL